ncbi:hypothetical protein [Rhizobium gallicum]|uniref:hypothetical protein n=1 Tax=Rhizobium gallicum TaxID=56730 RepID=UPI003B8A87B0
MPKFERDFARAVSATKSATGHLLGAVGGLGGIFAVRALRDQVTPPTLDLSGCGPSRRRDRLRRKPSPANGDVLRDLRWLGGVTASALFRRWTNELTGRAPQGPVIETLPPPFLFFPTSDLQPRPCRTRAFACLEPALMPPRGAVALPC